MTEKYYDIYKFTHSLIGRVIRFGPISIIVFLFLITEQSRDGIVNAAASIGIFLINEIFLAAKVSKTKPLSKISDKNEHLEKAMVFRARQIYEASSDGSSVFERLNKLYEVRFLIEKTGIKDIGNSKIQKDELLKQASEIAVFVKGNYITEVDLAAAYLILSEYDTKILSQNDLTNEDIINIAYWARKRFGLDNFEKKRMEFTGSGVFDSLVTGWNYEIRKYTRDLTTDVFNSHFPPKITGHENEFDQLTIALSKSDSSNAILIGNPGVGKTTLIEYLAHESFLGNLPNSIHHKRVYELLVDRLLAGVENQGVLQERLSLLFSELSHSGNVIIYIQNIENIFGGGGFGFDMSGVLSEYIHGNRIKIVGTTDPASFDAFINSKPSVNEDFEAIEVKEFDVAKTLLLISEISEEKEKKNNVKVLYSALKQAVVLAPVYYPDKYYPGSAIVLLDEVIAAAKIDNKKEITGDDIIAIVKKKTNVSFAAPSNEEKKTLLHLEEKMKERIIGQEEAVVSVSDAMRRARSGFEEDNRPISVFLFLGPTGVGKTETAKVLARQYFGNENEMIRIDMSEIQGPSNISKIIGSAKGGYTASSLVEEVEKKPSSLILLDEFEKADRNVLNIFLQIFDEGHVTDARGKTVSFKNTIVIATSNAGAEYLRERPVITKDDFVDLLLQNNIFSPELINRFDSVILFRVLAEEEMVKIASILLSESFRKLEDDQIGIKADDKVARKVAKEGYSQEFGARNIRRYIENNVEKFISDLILEDKIKKGDSATLSVDENGGFIII